MTRPQTFFRVCTGVGLRGEVVAETLGELLWINGVQGIEEIRLDDGSICLQSSFGLDREKTHARLVEIVASMQDSELSYSGSRQPVDWQIFDVDQAITESWRDHVSEFEVSSEISVVPSWKESEPKQTSVRGRRPIRLVIDPGSTFGMGDHPSTRGALRMIERVLQPGGSVLDVGCGSGILGIAALKLGASHATGLDINPACVDVSQANAVRNGVEDRWSVSTSSLEEFSEPHDLIAANILAPVLIGFAESFRRLLSPGGTLIISGVLEGAFDHVLHALSPLRVVETMVIDNWTTLALKF